MCKRKRGLINTINVYDYAGFGWRAICSICFFLDNIFMPAKMFVFGAICLFMVLRSRINYRVYVRNGTASIKYISRGRLANANLLALS